MKTRNRRTINRMIRNSFCPTGPGGGVDPSCSPSTTVHQISIGSSGLKPISPRVIESIKSELESAPKYIKEALEKYPIKLLHLTYGHLNNDSVAQKLLKGYQASGTATAVYEDRSIVLSVRLGNSRDARASLWHEIGHHLGYSPDGDKLAKSMGYKGKSTDERFGSFFQKKVIQEVGYKEWNWTQTTNSYVVNPFVSEAQRRACYATDDPKWDCSEWESKTKGKLPKRKKPTTNAKKKLSTKLLRIDPTRTITLRRAFSSQVKARFDGLKAAILKAIADEDYFGIKDRKPFEPTGNYDPDQERDESGKWVTTTNTRWQFHSSPEKVAAFQKWLKGQVQQRITSKNQKALWDRYVQAGYQKGAGRAFDDTKATQRALSQGDQQKLDFYAGTKDQFLKSAFGRPVAVEKVQLLATRTFSDLEGVTDAMSTQMTRTLADGLVEGKSPFEVARDLVEDVDDIGIDRARTIARTELIRAHAEGQLDALDEMGVEEVGVAVEWSTTQDEKVCPKCAPLEGMVLKIEEARGLLPRHPNCRCAWIPANVSEEDKEQKDTKGGIMGAIADSMAEGDDGWDEDLEIDKGRPQSTFNTGRFSGLLNQFCATGPGGGQDNSCGREGVKASKGEWNKAKRMAQEKIKNAPTPTKEQVAKAKEEMKLAAQGKGRPGGESRGGGSADRRRQRINLFKEFGGEQNGYITCPWTGIKMHWTDDPKENPNGYPKFERGKIFTKCQGGGYQLPNLIPESFAANRSRNDTRVREENSRGC